MEGLAGQDLRRILVRSTNWVGDALMSTPALAVLKENFPRAEVTVLARRWVAPVFLEHPAVDRVILYERSGRHQGWRGRWRLARELRALDFDLAVLFQNAFEAAFLAWLARIPLRLGYNTDARGFLLNRAVRLRPEDKQVHETEYYLRLLARAGLKNGATRPVFYLSAGAEAAAAQRLEKMGLAGSFLLGLAPGAAYGPAKQWPAERFAAAARLILDRMGGAVLIFGSQAEAEAAGRVKALLGVAAHDLAGRTELTAAAALIKHCRLVLTNDSGLMHVAAGVDTPLVAVFGSTNPATTAPVSDQARLIRHELPCAPCLKTVCDQPTHRCMELVSPEEVAAAGLELVAGEGERHG